MTFAAVRSSLLFTRLFTRLFTLLFTTTISVFLSANSDAAGVDADARSITVSIYQEPRILDSTSSPSVEFTAEVMVHLQEGLMRYDERRRLVGGVASSWELTPTQVKFNLRPDARWENGKPVTASDFIFAWQLLVSPENGSPSANLASPIVNGGKITRGDAAKEALGVRAVSASELVIDLAHPCSWCLELMTSPAFYPVNQAFYESTDGDYGSSPDTHLANGPFRLKTWQRGKYLVLEKNERYWGNARVGLGGLRFDYIGTDAKSLLNLYKSNELAVISLDRDTVMQGLELGQRIRSYATGYLMNIQFSHRETMATANENLRKAIALVIDKEDLVNRVVAIPGTRVADSMFHDWLAIGDINVASFVTPQRRDADIELAKRHIEHARQELGRDEITITFTTFVNSTMKRVAEYLQERLRLIDVELKVDPQTVQILVDKWHKGTSDMTLIGWIPDVNDPMDQISFLGNPDIRKLYQGLYAGEDMSLIYFAYREATTEQARIAAVTRAHDFFRERITVFPLFELYDSTLVNPAITGYVFNPVRGFSDYRYVRFLRD